MGAYLSASTFSHPLEVNALRNLRLVGTACVLGIAVAACSSSNALTGVTPGSANQPQGHMRNGIGPNGILSRTSTLPGWMSPDKKKKAKKLLYASDEGQGYVEIFKVPSYSMVGEITSGINEPEGIATDKKGNLYVSNLGGNTVTVYKPGKTSPSLTLSETDGPDDVAVGSNGYVYAADVEGGIDVYPPGATSPTTRLTSSNLAYGVFAVGVDGSNNVYGGGFGAAGAAVVEFANASGSGTNLGLTGLEDPSGILIDNKNDVVVSDFELGEILIYPSGQTSPSSTIAAPDADRSAVNKTENEIFAPEGANDEVGVYDYPSGTLVTNIPLGGFTSGTALSPAPAP
jgi:hypothetical protein